MRRDTEPLFATTVFLLSILLVKGKDETTPNSDEQTKCGEESNDISKDEKLALEERFKAAGGNHQIDLESKHCSHDETFKKFQEDTQRNLLKALLE
ncbi:hypothetical protein PVK06_035077 [Gossypium arboreum]|uniref:Uncharacterized protein n=1 Tax=Gossypium arboreum TaxID=29729 RepID=A0ABR0NFX2_GOSAR|nr:hypothetical protein PVK06_035077 [Gossypium arboreum]